jgi:hypothetical protein
MDLQRVGYESKDWIDMSEDRDSWLSFVNSVMNFSDSIKCAEFLDYLISISFSRRTLFHGVSK